MRRALVLGAGGFIGGHLAKRLQDEGFRVTAVDIKEKPEFWLEHEICHRYVCADLRKHDSFEAVFELEDEYDEVYQLPADMGGAGYLFTGDNDADVMHNSALINLNCLELCARFKVGRVFYSSSACVYPEHNQMDLANPNCEESSVYPAAPDSEYGWEKLFSERLYLSFEKNYAVPVRIARFHNVYGPQGTWDGGKEKVPAAICRKVATSAGEIEIWGDGNQTRSFLFIDDCVEAVLRFTRQDDFMGPVNIGSEEMVSINRLAAIAMKASGRNLKVEHIEGPIGVRGRTSDNTLYRQKMKWSPTVSLEDGIARTYQWIEAQVSA